MNIPEIAVLDCSVALTEVLPDEFSTDADAVFEAIELENLACIAPSHFMLEYVNGLLVAKRRKRISTEKLLALMEQAQDFALEIDKNGDIGDILALAEKYGLTMYDAAYLELAIRKKAKLATLDKALAKAAKKEKVGFRV